MSASHCEELIEQAHSCDFNPRLNTSSYVNVVSEPQERNVAELGAQVNLADASVYPASVKIHDSVVNMLANLWNAPRPDGGADAEGDYVGAGTVGSTEACLLAGLALKFRWRGWYARTENLSEREVLGVRPNLVISSCYQAAWEKFFRYFDVEPRFCKPRLLDGANHPPMAVDAQELCRLCDQRTIGVVAILGNHYNGAYDPVWEINDEIDRINAANNWQLAVHIDAGKFIRIYT
jgi:glutamate decarboxylase